MLFSTSLIIHVHVSAMYAIGHLHTLYILVLPHIYLYHVQYAWPGTSNSWHCGLTVVCWPSDMEMDIDLEKMIDERIAILKR